MKEINIGLIGFGTIGCGVVKIFKEKASLLEPKLQAKLILKKICDKNLKIARDVKVEPELLTADPYEIINDDSIDIVIELIGGIEPAREFVLAAIAKRKHVVTANKALLAECGKEIFAAAKKNSVEVYFEGSVGGGIPVIKALREGFVVNQIENIYGIINGTSNYILSQMARNGINFKNALKKAQNKGYAEQDPGFDISGVDSAHKLTILARMCFSSEISLSDVYVEGIEDIELSDIHYAAELGFSIKLLAIAKKSGNKLQIRVHPTLLPKDHLLANVHGVYNAIFINADLVGESLFYGRGAGQQPTASAVMSDVVSIAEKISGGSGFNRSAEQSLNPAALEICPIDDISLRYYIRILAIDQPAVLSKISDILGRYQISIHSVIQKGRRQEQSVPIVMMTHEAKEKNLRQAMSLIDELDIIKSKSIAIRIESL